MNVRRFVTSLLLRAFEATRVAIGRFDPRRRKRLDRHGTKAMPFDVEQLYTRLEAVLNDFSPFENWDAQFGEDVAISGWAGDLSHANEVGLMQKGFGPRVAGFNAEALAPTVEDTPPPTWPAAHKTAHFADPWARVERLLLAESLNGMGLSDVGSMTYSASQTVNRMILGLDPSRFPGYLSAVPFGIRTSARTVLAAQAAFHALSALPGPPSAAILDTGRGVEEAEIETEDIPFSIHPGNRGVPGGEGMNLGQNHGGRALALLLDTAGRPAYDFGTLGDWSKTIHYRFRLLAPFFGGSLDWRDWTLSDDEVGLSATDRAALQALASAGTHDQAVIDALIAAAGTMPLAIQFTWLHWNTGHRACFVGLNVSLGTFQDKGPIAFTYYDPATDTAYDNSPAPFPYDDSTVDCALASTGVTAFMRASGVRGQFDRTLPSTRPDFVVSWGPAGLAINNFASVPGGDVWATLDAPRQIDGLPSRLRGRPSMRSWGGQWRSGVSRPSHRLRPMPRR